MKELNYRIIAPEMVWQWYYDENKEKHFRELLGKDAQKFIQMIVTDKEVYIEDILSLPACRF